MSLKQVKNQIRSIDKIHKVTRAMEAVSAVKMRKSQERALVGRPYAMAALSILHRVSKAVDTFKHPLTEKREVKNICLIVIASDRGLAGSLNSHVLRKAEGVLKPFEKRNIHIVAVGKKAVDYFKKRNYEMFFQQAEVPDEITEAFTEKMMEEIVAGYAEELFDQVMMVYPNFHSTFEQESVSRVMLPLEPESIREIVEGIVPVRGKFSSEPEEHEEKKESERLVAEGKPYLIEPDEESVLSVLFPSLLAIELYHAILEEKASEHSARMVAMKNASDKAGELSKAFNLQYNKERQALITAEVSEIVSGLSG